MGEKMIIMQGDAYDVEITLKTEDGTVITPAIAEMVEFMLGKLRKTYPGDVVFDDGVWAFPLSQRETQSMGGVKTMEARVKFSDDTVIGASIAPVMIAPALSREEL